MQIYLDKRVLLGRIPVNPERSMLRMSNSLWDETGELIVINTAVSPNENLSEFVNKYIIPFRNAANSNKSIKIACSYEKFTQITRELKYTSESISGEAWFICFNYQNKRHTIMELSSKILNPYFQLESIIKQLSQLIESL